MIGDAKSPLTIPLLAGKSIEVGTVDVWKENDSLRVRYSTTWSLVETHLEVVTNVEHFPMTKKGNPIPGHFTYKMSHSRGTTTYTYPVAMTGFGDAKTLYFAAHAEVEQLSDGVSARTESAWAAGSGFPGANWATYFAGAMPAGIDLTGYWDWWFTPVGKPESGPVLLYIHQTEDSALYCSMGISGSISGSTVEFSWEVMGLLMQGTVSGGEIKGDIISSPFGTGSFRMVFPSSAPFGHLELEGNVDGIPVSLPVVPALGGGGRAEHRYNYYFDLNAGGFMGRVWLQTRSELSTGLYTVTGSEPWAADEMLVTLWPSAGGEIRATGKTVDVKSYDGSAIAGILDLQFPDGWQLFVDMPSPVPLDRSESIDSHFQAVFFDHERVATVWLSVNGLLGETTYEVPDVWCSLRWTLNGEGLEDHLIQATKGSLTISRFDESGIAGFFDIGETPGDRLRGAFDLSWWEQWEPGD